MITKGAGQSAAQESLISHTSAWKNLKNHAKTVKPMKLRSLLSENAERNDNLRFTINDWNIDFTRQRIDTKGLELLLKLAETSSLQKKIKDMVGGEIVNNTENRAALHVALRATEEEEISTGGQNVVPEVHRVLKQMEDFTNKIYNGEWKGHTEKTVTNVVSLGIGGSDLGPKMAVKALEKYNQQKVKVHFVSNVDPYDLTETLGALNPEETLFIIASKSFGTPETMANAHAAREWVTSALGEEAVSKHFVAISTNVEKATEFGIDPNNLFDMWDWVGGRFSVTCAVGLSVMLAIGPDNFKEMLSGFHDMDEHYLNTPFEKNVPVIMALLNIWNTNFLEFSTHGVIPYDERLDLFAMHLQQLIMESLGKGVTHSGNKIDYTACPVFYPGVGSNSQHSFFQLLHQGSGIVSPIDFMAFAEPADPKNKEQHKTLVFNMIAQANVMAKGVTSEELKESGNSNDIIPHKKIPGNKPSTILYSEQLTPRTLGQLTALYEHMVHAWGSILDINPFDQMGVEAGKIVAKGLEEKLPGEMNVQELGNLLKHQK